MVTHRGQALLRNVATQGAGSNDGSALTPSLSFGSAIGYAYDSVGRRTAITNLSLGALFNYAYDGASRLQSASFGGYSVDYGYMANCSLATNLVFKQSGVTRMTKGKQYDNLNRLKPSGSVSQRVSESDRSADVHVRSMPVTTRNIQGTMEGAGGNRWGTGLQFEQYSVNALDRYTQRTVPGVLDIIGTATNGATVTVNNRSSERQGDFFHVKLDLANQEAAVWASITNVAVLNQGTNDLIATNLGNLFLPKTPELFAYDADGNLTNDGRWSYTWDAENRLIQMTAHASLPAGARKELKFAYDDQGRRIYRRISAWTGSSYTPTQTNYYYWSGWTCIGEYFPGGGRSYLWGSDLSGTMEGAGGVGGLLMAWDGSSAHFYAYDGNGNVSATVSGGDGTITATYEYDPFGKVLRETGSYAKTNPYRFSTKYTDADTDLVYYGYRYYNPSVGRWPNRDPIGEAGGVNLYEVRWKQPNQTHRFSWAGLSRTGGVSAVYVIKDGQWILR